MDVCTAEVAAAAAAVLEATVAEMEELDKVCGTQMFEGPEPEAVDRPAEEALT